MISHLHFGSSTWVGRKSAIEQRGRVDNWRIKSLHLEHADTGLDTRNNGLSEKLDLGISALNLLSTGSGGGNGGQPWGAAFFAFLQRCGPGWNPVRPQNGRLEPIELLEMGARASR